MKNIVKVCLICVLMCILYTTVAFADTYVNTAVDNKSGIITVSGKLNDDINAPAGIYILQDGVESFDGITPETAGEYINHIEQIVTDENGEFEFTYKLISGEGKYNVFLSNFDGTKKAQTQFVYISSDALNGYIDSIAKKIDPLDTKNDFNERVSDVYDILSSEIVLNAFGIIESDLPADMTFEDIDSELCGYIVRTELPCQTKDDIKQIVLSALAAKAFNGADEAEYDLLFEEFKEYLGINEKIFEMYNSSDTFKSDINDKFKDYEFISADDVSYALTECVVMKKYKDMTHYSEFMQLVNDTDNAMDFDEDDLNDYNSIKSPGKQSNVDKGMLDARDTVKNLEDMKDEFADLVKEEKNKKTDSGSSSGGSGGSRGGAGNSIGNAVAIGTSFDTSSISFNDLAGVPWAKDAIEKLASKGIVSGYGDGSFKPGNSILREEAVKIIISACKLFDSNAVCEFSDVSATAWYAKYVASASNLGIVSGMGDGSFGTGKPITRQDMAVVINNMISTLGIDCPAVREYNGFADEQEISAYAFEAVKKLYCAGIINGNNLNEFNPADSLTRAEMAKLIVAVPGIAE